MAAELLAKRRQEALPERIVRPRTEAREESRGQRRERHAALNGVLEHPASFAGVFDVRLQLRQVRVPRESAGSELQQPGSDDAAMLPERRDRGDVDLVVAGVQELES